MTQTIVLNDNEILEGKLIDGLDEKYDNIVIKVIGDNVVIRNCKFVNFKSGKFEALIKVEGKHCLIEDCLFTQLYHQGPIILTTSIYMVITDNIFLNRGNRTDNGNEVIRIENENEGKCLIYRNRLENCDGDVNIISVNCDNNIISHNEILSCQGNININRNSNIICFNKIDGTMLNKSGGIILNGDHHLVIHNYISNLIKNGITILNGEKKPSSQTMIFDNYFTKCKTALDIGYSIYKSVNVPIDTIIEDNVFIDCDRVFSDNKGRNNSINNNRVLCDKFEIDNPVKGFIFTPSIRYEEDKPEFKFDTYEQCKELVIDYLKNDKPEIEEEKEENNDEVFNKLVVKFEKRLLLRDKYKEFSELKSKYDKLNAKMKNVMNEISTLLK